MTDLDGKNLLGVLKEETEITMFQSWRQELRIQGQFFWSTGNKISETHNRMPMRSRALVSQIRLEIISNASSSPTIFAVRKSKIASAGLDSITDETLDAFQFLPSAGQTGIFTTPDTIDYAIDDYICFKYREIDANFNMVWKMSCQIDFFKI